MKSSAHASSAITFWGHACCAIRMNGVDLVTDPVFARSYSPINWRTISPPPEGVFARTGVILISHAHFDHLNPRTLATFLPTTTILCPSAAAPHVRKITTNFHVMKPDDVYELDGTAVTAVPAHHPGGRYALRPRNNGDALGFVVRAAGKTVYYSGDTEYFPGLQGIGGRYQIDVAIMNISVHLRSENALRAFAAIGARKLVPAHHGAYTSTQERRSAGWRVRLKEVLGGAYAELAVGETFHF